MKHTQGKWEITPNTRALTIISKKTGCRIAQCSKDANYTATQQANARLISKAPCMYEALKVLANEAERVNNGDLHLVSAIGDARQLINQIEGK